MAAYQRVDDHSMKGLHKKLRIQLMHHMPHRWITMDGPTAGGEGRWPAKS